MTNDNLPMSFSNKGCLTDEDLYSYITGQGSADRLSSAEAHFVKCSYCRHKLSGLIGILHPDIESTTGIPDLSKPELDRTLAIIQEVSRKEHPGRRRLPRWLQWPIAAAAAVGFITLCLLGIKHLYEKNKSETFFSEAKAMLEQSYTGTSPGNLRLALPFSPTSTNRSDAGLESLHRAENLFFQALAVRGDMAAAHLGLGYIYLSESKFDRARNEFKKVLEIQNAQYQALLGHGVAQYEEAVQISDPLRRDLLLKAAIGDFNAVLKLNPESKEARYNKIWALFESGMHKDALQEIELYLSLDPDSNWAEGLKGLRTKMKATRLSAVEDEVNRAACAGDRAALAELSRQASYQMPAAIWSAMRRSLAMDGQPVNNGSPSSRDLQWAAETLETAYSASTGDHSFRAFIDFYVGLSPPAREIKKSLDRKFQSLVKLHQNGEFSLTLRNSKSLEYQYAKIGDSWQLANLHRLRGNSFYLGMADFRAAESEFRKMYKIADHLTAPDLTANALQALAMIYGAQRKFDQSIACAIKMKNLAEKYKLNVWEVYACISLGNQYHLLGRYPLALHEYAIALTLASRFLDGLKIVEALERSGIVMDRLGRADEAGAYYRLALQRHDDFLRTQQVKPIPELTIRRLNLLFRQGDLALRSGDLAGAESFFQESLKSGQQGMRELEARNRLGLAEVYLRTRRIREAELALEPVIALIPSNQYPDIEWQAKFMKGSLLEATGRASEALLLFQDSIKTLERMRQNIKPGDMRQSFLAGRYDPFRAAISLLFQSSGERQKLLEFVDRAKSITLKEHLKQQNSGIESRLESTEYGTRSFTTIEYFFTQDKLLIFVTGQDKVEAVARNISIKEMDRQVGKFLEYIRNNDAKNFAKMAQRLYEELIAPVEDCVFAHKSENLVILPDGPLYLLPFAGLQDTTGRFLIERTPIAFAPSRSIFRHCLLTERESSVADFNIVLIDGSAGLPSARDELAYITNLYRGNALLLGAKDLLLSARPAEQSDILHFSGHAFMQEGKPVLMLQKFPREIFLDCRAIRSWNLPRSRLVNLAGCSTGIGPMAEGESPWGLIPAFLDAGAPAIIASLTEVDDVSTMRLNCRFYDLLQRGSGKAKALQGAQLALLNSVRSDSNIKPQSWVPYILVGNPQ